VTEHAADRAIDAVLFDFGGVFTESPFDAARTFAESIGVDPQTMLDTVFGPYDRDSDHPWHRLERGEVDLMAAREHILDLGRARGFDSDVFRVLSALGRSGGGARQAFLDRARWLRERGIKSAIVTNNAKEFRDAWRGMIPVTELFDHVIDSSEVGYRKPDPRIYRKALEILGNVPPSRSVFLDDYEGNVAAARALGIHGIVVGPDPTAALAEFDRLLGV
jgi:putative hydrolase of the HAD superfamily